MRHARLALTLTLLALALLGPLAPPPARAQAGPGLVPYGHLGGRLTAVALRPPYAFVGLGASLTIVNAASTGPSLSPLSAVPLGQFVVDIALAGDYAYAIGLPGFGAGELYVVDVRNPASPLLAHTIALARDTLPALAVAQGRLYIFSGGLRIYDLADPARPSLLAVDTQLHDPFNRKTLAAVPGYLFVATAFDGLRVFDVRSDRPALVNQLSLNATFEPPDLALEGDRLYSFARTSSESGELQVFDIAAPAQPRQLGARRGVGSSGQIGVSSQQIFWTGETVQHPTDFAPELRLFDARDPANIVQVGARSISGRRSNIAVAGGIAMLITNDRTLERVVAADPARPLVTGAYTPPSAAVLVSVSGERAVMSWLVPERTTESDSNQLVALGLGDRRSPQPLGPGVLAPWGRLHLSGDLLLGAAGSAARMYRLGADGGLRELGRLEPGGYVEDAVARADVAYVAGDSGVSVFDIADPAQPRLLDSLATGAGYQIRLSAARAFVAPRCPGVGELPASLPILSLANPRAPTVAGTLTVPCDSAIAAAPDGNTLYRISDECTPRSCPSILRIIDVTDPAAPAQRGTLSLGATTVTALAFAQGHLVVGLRQVGEDILRSGGLVLLIDVRDSARPAVAGAYETSYEPVDLAVAGPYIFVPGGGAGLSILRAEALFQPAERVYLPRLGR